MTYAISILNWMALHVASACLAQGPPTTNIRVSESRASPEVSNYRKSLRESIPSSNDFAVKLSPAIKTSVTHREGTPFEQTVPGFRVLCESGTEYPAMIRLQISADQYYSGPGDGGTLDVAHQLFKLLPSQHFITAIERKHLNGFLQHLREWNVDPHLVILPQDLPVAQWAQDNGKSGRVKKPDGTWKSVLLVPRFASRGESPTIFVPGESFLADALSEAGVEVAQSPLVFQGGNLLPVFDPARKKTILLIGEAEVHRNAGTRWSSPQIVEAFRTEFGADECVVLPAASFHIDYELTARTKNDCVMAFVNDPESAHSMVIDIGLRILESHSIVSGEEVNRIREFLTLRDSCSAARLLQQIIDKMGGPDGQFPLQITDWFQKGAADSGVGNFQRFLASCDYVCSGCTTISTTPARTEFLQSIRKSQLHRAEMVAQLKQLGWKITYIPSTSDDELSLNYLNGVQLREQFLMPAYGGLFGELDEAAHASFERALPGLKVIDIHCGESQRRNGALHCSISVL